MIIYVNQRVISVNLADPLEVKYDECPDGYNRYILMNYPCGIPVPTQDEISYMFDEFTGIILKI